ncbi:hypothetical protein ACQPYE_17150 [Actinosynnema sp. CA-299493]
MTGPRGNPPGGGSGGYGGQAPPPVTKPLDTPPPGSGEPMTVDTDNLKTAAGLIHGTADRFRVVGKQIDNLKYKKPLKREKTDPSWREFEPGYTKAIVGLSTAFTMIEELFRGLGDQLGLLAKAHEQTEENNILLAQGVPEFGPPPQQKHVQPPPGGGPQSDTPEAYTGEYVTEGPTAVKTTPGDPVVEGTPLTGGAVADPTFTSVQPVQPPGGEQKHVDPQAGEGPPPGGGPQSDTPEAYTGEYVTEGPTAVKTTPGDPVVEGTPLTGGAVADPTFTAAEPVHPVQPPDARHKQVETDDRPIGIPLVPQELRNADGETIGVLAPLGAEVPDTGDRVVLTDADGQPRGFFQPYGDHTLDEAISGPMLPALKHPETVPLQFAHTYGDGDIPGVPMSPPIPSLEGPPIYTEVPEENVLKPAGASELFTGDPPDPRSHATDPDSTVGVPFSREGEELDGLTPPGGRAGEPMSPVQPVSSQNPPRRD